MRSCRNFLVGMLILFVLTLAFQLIFIFEDNDTEYEVTNIGQEVGIPPEEVEQPYNFASIDENWHDDYSEGKLQRRKSMALLYQFLEMSLYHSVCTKFRLMTRPPPPHPTPLLPTHSL